MKKLLSLFAFASLNLGTFAQVNLEHIFSTTTQQNEGFQQLWLTNLGNNNYKYVIYTQGFSANCSLSLYNLDYSPYMLNIQIPLKCDSTKYIYYKCGYVTTSLFDCDSSTIEFAIMLDTPRPDVHPNTAIYRTDGTLLFSKDSVGTYFCVGCGSGSWETHPIMHTPVGAKMYLFNYADSQGNFDPNGHVLRTYIYGLCGSLPENIAEINQSTSFVNAFPNPSSRQINFEIIPPSHLEVYELTIFNSAFQVISTNIIDGQQTHLSIDGTSLSSGTYFYSLQNKNKVFQTGKFVLTN